MVLLSDFDKVLEENLFNPILEDINCRYRSWEHCYAFFYKNKERIIHDDMLDTAVLNLGFYLGNWGMFRKLFLIDKDYKIHIQVISKLLNECKELWQPYDKISKILLCILCCVPAYDRYFMLAAKNSNGLIYHNYSERSNNDIRKVLSKLNYEDNRYLLDNKQITYY